MNKKDFIIVGLLVLMIPLWLFVDRKFIAPKIPAPAAAPVEEVVEPPVDGSAKEESVISAAPAVAEEAPIEVVEPSTEEITAELNNDKVVLELSSFGAGIKSATMLDYPELNEKESGPVVLDFSDSHALAYEGLKGISANEPLDIQVDESGRTATFTKAWNSNTAFKRTVTLDDGYMLTITDRFINNGSGPWNLPSLRILTGRMKNPENTTSQKGVVILGVDSYSPSGDINYWGRKLNKLYKNSGNRLSIDTVPEDMYGVMVDWVSAKNKFFTQILRPTEVIATMSVLSHGEKEKKRVVPTDVAAALVLPFEAISADDTYEVTYNFFIGPKKYKVLQDAGYNMEGIMEFRTIGFWSGMNWLMHPARKALLWTLNAFHSIIPNFGVAIILLTVLIRILFWPLTHKSTESMKRMQEIQPEIKAIQAKYKGKKDQASAQKIQAETMALYKEHKVNPMGGCLPMFVQIPVFIALFTVLRNAIELRYASFLWIADLSAPENLFAGSVPFVGSLNILPLLMAGSMFWQQKMTPQAAATPEQQQQQKMMMYMMPVMMLFFFYKMPSGLVLYWTTSQLLMILQMSLRNMKKKKAEA